MNSSAKSTSVVDITNPDTVLSYVVDWYDPLPQIKKKFVLKFFPTSNSIEMLRHDNNKVFLRKTVLPENSLKFQDIRLGKFVTLFGRSLEFVDYFDSFTLQCSASAESSYTFYFPYEPSTLSSIIASHTSQGRELLKLNMLVDKDDDLNVIIECKVSGNSPTPEKPFNRSNYHQSYSLSSCTLLIVKSQAMIHLPEILADIIEANFCITGIKIHQFTQCEADELLQVYFDVIPSAGDMATNLTCGLNCCLELRAEHAVIAARELCGPLDCSVAKELRPNSLRGKYGLHGIDCNGLHTTDLEEDGIRECEYVFACLN